MDSGDARGVGGWACLPGSSSGLTVDIWQVDNNGNMVTGGYMMTVKTDQQRPDLVGSATCGCPSSSNCVRGFSKSWKSMPASFLRKWGGKNINKKK